MELNSDFEVDAPIGQVWAVLTDVEKIAPCLPGAQLQEIEGDEFRGVVKIKVGPITAQYKGAASFVERDDSAFRAVPMARMLASRLAWVSTTPLGSPVLPDVYCRKATSSERTATRGESPLAKDLSAMEISNGVTTCRSCLTCDRR